MIPKLARSESCRPPPLLSGQALQQKEGDNRGSQSTRDQREMTRPMPCFGRGVDLLR